MSRLILASKSPRRKRILDQLGLVFDMVPSLVEEHSEPGLSPSSLVRKLSSEKAEAVAKQFAGAVVIAADTIVVLDGKVLGQPGGEQEAKEMLRKLSGRSHEVYTGVSLLRTDNRSGVTDRCCFHERTKVTFASLTEQEISTYVRSGSPLDKAGAYGIQDDWGSVFVSRIEGDFYNVVGFPVHRFYQHMKTFAPELIRKSMMS